MRYSNLFGLVVVVFACSKSGLAVKPPGIDAEAPGKLDVALRDVVPLFDMAEDVPPSPKEKPDLSWLDSKADSALAVRDGLGDRGVDANAGDVAAADDTKAAAADSGVPRLDAAAVDARSGSLVPGEIACGTGLTCSVSTGPCCPSATSMSRNPLCAKNCVSPPVFCDGPEDCANDQVCCSIESATTGFSSASCTTTGQCAAPSRRVCHVDADCLSGQRCGVPTPLPATPYSPSEIDVWVVSYLVCAS